MILNKTVRISLMGGLLGAILTNPNRALNDCIMKHNQEGWRSTFIMPHATSNLFIRFIQILSLICTLGLWSWGGGYLVMFERDAKNNVD